MAVSAKWLGGLQTDTQVLGTEHLIHGDEPESLGGEDTGPNPFALLQTSLANCMIVTMVGEAELIGAPLEDVTVEVRHKQNKMVRGPRDPEQRTMRMTQLRRKIKLRGDLTEEQVQRLLWAAENCPVSNSLEGGIEMITEIEHEPASRPLRSTG